MLLHVLRTATSEDSQHALCVAAIFVLMAMPLEGCCCRKHRSSTDSSAASSEEDFVGSEDARIQRCVRTVAPNLLVDGTYTHVAKVDSCAAQGMSAISSGTAPADAATVISDCIDAQSFPDALVTFVSDFKDCVNRVLT